jgi:mycothiol synthase
VPDFSLHVEVTPTDALDTATRAALRGLLDAGAAGGATVSDQARIDLERPPHGVERPLAVLVWRGPGELAGYAALAQHAQTGWAVEPVVAPGDGIDTTEVVGHLVARARDEVARRGGGILRLWLHEPGPDDHPPSGLGLHTERDLLQMRVALPLDVPGPAVGVRAFRPGTDDDAWLAVNNRAFAEHPEQSAWTVEDLARREAEPWFDPAGFLLHEATGRLAAFCWTKVHADEGLGEIYVIGVDPDFQGRGLGRALTVAGFAHLTARGVPTGMLYVDAANAAAVGLYRSLGMGVHHVDRAFVADVSPDGA